MAKGLSIENMWLQLILMLLWSGLYWHIAGSS